MPPSYGLTHEVTQGLAVRHDLRNVAIVAHVDHGKTTLVDALLRQSGAFDTHAQVDERVMDSMDLEREKGITILAKNTAVQVRSGNQQVTLNIVDTPGHADFGGEVERALSMVDGVLLLVDASEGPLPQTRFVLRKALNAAMPLIIVINKVDRPDARIAAVLEETYELFFELMDDEAAPAALDFPVVYCSGKAGKASLMQPSDGQLPHEDDLGALVTTLLSTIPAPTYTPGAPLQAQVTNLDASAYLGRLALLRIRNGTLNKGQTVAWCRADGSVTPMKISQLLLTQALERVPAEQASAGDLVAVAGIADITLGETLCDLEHPDRLPLLEVDEPSLSMTFGINTSPLAGRSGTKLTARLLKARLDAELVGNVSLAVLPTNRPDMWQVQGRGELALAILVETMRREGFELTVGKPQVVTIKKDGHVQEPIERLTVDVPEEHIGAVTGLVGQRRGTMQHMVNPGLGWTRLDFLVAARGLIGFRNEFLTVTRGTGLMHHVFDSYAPWQGEIRTRASGSLVADRAGAVTSFASINLQERATLFVEPGTLVYEGMVVGENSRGEDMDVNITKEKKLTNMRASTSDELVRLTPARTLTLEQSLGFCRDDECVEVTPDATRLRKVELQASHRAKLRNTVKS